MTIFIRSLCVLSCVVSGFYCFVIFRNFKKSLNITWFGLFCFSMAFFSNFDYFIRPDRLINETDPNTYTDNIFLMSLALTVLVLNIYAHNMSGKRKEDPHRLLILLSAVATCLTMLVPPFLNMATYYVLTGLSLITSALSMIQAVRLSKDRSRTFFFSVFSLSLITTSLAIDLVFRIKRLPYVNPLLFALPVYMFFQLLRLSNLYNESIMLTQKLSASLSDTIAKINHSSDALLCTQMKADFLYKTLDLIKQKCDEEPFTAEDLTVSLSKYLRHTLNFQQLKGAVPLNNEIELTKAYISIEKERNRNITFEYHFPTPLPEFHIPPMTIQPLVENAIEHGSKGQEGGGKITITIIPYRNYYHIDISDNGIGMDEHTARSLTEELHETARIGIYNIHTRLKNLFGKGLVIQSAAGVGTSVSFVVPVESDEQAEKEVKDE